MRLMRYGALLVAALCAWPAHSYLMDELEWFPEEPHHNVHEYVELSLCNTTHYSVRASLARKLFSYEPRGTRTAYWIVEGWYVVEAGQCQTMVVPRDGLYAYGRTVAYDREWTGTDRYYCVLRWADSMHGRWRQLNYEGRQCDPNYEMPIGFTWIRPTAGVRSHRFTFY